MERLLLVLCFVGLNAGLLAQEYAVDKGATFLSGMGSFSSQGGDLFAGFGDERATTVTLFSSFNYFVARNFFVGGGLDLSRQSQGNYTVTSWGIGPQIGYAVGNENSSAFPYVSAGLRYNSIAYGNANGNGTDVFFALGAVTVLRSHVGLVFEGGYHIVSLKTSTSGTATSGNIISLSIGIVGLLH